MCTVPESCCFKCKIFDEFLLFQDAYQNIELIAQNIKRQRVKTGVQ